MPIYEYRCECGAKVEALVRSGREPVTGDEAGHFCNTSGKLTRLLSAFAIGSSGGFSGFDSATGAACEAADASCGHCGQTPGSCAYES